MKRVDVFSAQILVQYEREMYLVEAEALKCRSEDFFIMRSRLNYNEWNIVHRHTGRVMLEGVSTAHYARMFAAIFAALPMPWFSSSHDVIVAAEATLSDEWRAWRRLVQSIYQPAALKSRLRLAA